MKFIGRNTHQRRRYGLTLIECVVAMTILPLAVTAIALAITSGQAQALEAMNRTRAAMVAEDLMEEVLALPYNDPDGASNLGPEAGESNRTKFDNADDFHGYTESAGNLIDATGASYPTPIQRFDRSVTCANTSITVTGLGNPIAGLEVTVTVSFSGNPVCTVKRFIPQST